MLALVLGLFKQMLGMDDNITIFIFRGAYQNVKAGIIILRQNSQNDCSSNKSAAFERMPRRSGQLLFQVKEFQVNVGIKDKLDQKSPGKRKE